MSARRRVAILGGGMGGLTAAWRLSEPGWRDRFERITVYQRGWRLGGKGASSRGRHGRIQEHGLHVWLGFYENAFRVLRECYEELDRPRSDPRAPILTWRDAIRPASAVGLEDRERGDWRHWLARFAPNDLEPGDPGDDHRPVGLAEFALRALRLIIDGVESLADVGGMGPTGRVVLSTSAEPPERSLVDSLALGTQLAMPAALLEATRLARLALGGGRSAAGGSGDGDPTAGIADAELLGALDRIQDWLRGVVTDDPDLRRTWQYMSLTVALLRGLVADGVFAGVPLAQLDDEDYRAWIRRHGGPPEAVDGALLRALYDMTFAYVDGDTSRPRFGAGSAVLLAVKMALEYKGGIFWKMCAGMGDIVFAPLYQALRGRGVDFEFFHRVDALHLSPDRTAVDSISVGRQASLAPGVERYEPLVRVRDLPCFPDAPLVAQLADAEGIEHQPLESHGCTWPDAELRVLRRGADFDVAVLAIPVGMARIVCGELIDDRPEWRAMVDNVATVATQAFQIWLREPEPALGWPHPGVTMSGYTDPFDTWASMPQLIGAEDWPDDDRPAAIAYFCGVLPTGRTMATPGDRDRYCDVVRERAEAFLDRNLRHLLPGAVDDRGFRWELLCGADGLSGPAALESQFWTANVDPSDRYVQSLPGTGRYRLRSDESGYDNLFLAGDWTDSGLNAGCIEAAVLSGLQAANAVLGRARNHRVVGYLPD